MSKLSINKHYYGAISALCFGLGAFNQAYSMGLRTFVALPVEKGGTVIRFSYVDTKKADQLIISGAYGINPKQTLLLGMPYRVSPSGKNRQGDISVLFRQMVARNDSASGTNRFGLLAGTVIPTNNERDPAVQAGVVYTHFKGRNEMDVDVLYQKGMEKRKDSGRYDVSWQYRLSPNERPDWGFVKELNSVVELNGRWNQGTNMTHQITLGLQQVHKIWVLEGGITQDINNDKDVSYLLSTRFHF